jgi:glycosyltransferase involved in cell wall biosynthesis
METAAPPTLAWPMSLRLSIVVPIHNEADFLGQGLSGLLAAVKETEVEAEVLLVENGSTDATAELARQLTEGSPATVISLPTPDYGAAMREGFLRSTGEWVVNFDIDYFSASFLKQVLELDETTDLVIGSKRDPLSEDHRPPLRRLATSVFNLLLRSLFNSRVSDTHGMKAFRRQLIADLAGEVRSRQDLFDTELVLRAERSGYRIREVPVVVEEMRATRSSLVRRVPRTIKGLLAIRRILRSGS